MQIFIRRNNDQRGPFDLFTIQQGLDSGKILPTDSAWYEGAPGWVFVSQLPGIKTNKPAVPPPHPDDYKTRRIGDTPPAPLPHPTMPPSVSMQTQAPQATTFQPVSVGCLPMIGAFVGVLVGYIVLYSLFVALIGEAAAALVMVLLVFGSLVWVYIDASALKTDQGQVTGFVNMSPGRWTFACFLIWIIAFPIYLVTRNEIKKVNDSRHN